MVERHQQHYEATGETLWYKQLWPMLKEFKLTKDGAWLQKVNCDSLESVVWEYVRRMDLFFKGGDLPKHREATLTVPSIHIKFARFEPGFVVVRNIGKIKVMDKFDHTTQIKKPKFEFDYMGEWWMRYLEVPHSQDLPPNTLVQQCTGVN